ncbi:MAG TPA: uroporphyrinogen decarboxylase family protein [Planctomycetota bacterium]|nr:uroporphyrinogen decarboxylase family protein [Planctomycetota bacterium]
MTGKERFLAAVRHEIPDRLPLAVMGIDENDAVARRLGCAPEEVAEIIGLDSLGVAAPYVGPQRTAPDGSPLSFWGTLRERYGAGRDYPIAPDATLDAIERYPWPSADDFDYAALAADARRLGSHLALRSDAWHPLFCQVFDLMGMEEAMLTLAARPAVYDAVVEHVFRFVLEHAKKTAAACGDDLPVLGIGDDFASQRGLMISPRDWRRVFKPRYEALFRVGKDAGKFVLFHSCGDVSAVLDDLVDIGMDIWQTVQLHTLPFSPEELKRRYGKRLTFFGGISGQHLPFATPDEVRAEVVGVIRALGKGGGYIVSPDHAVKPGTPIENILALYDAARSFRETGYTQQAS